MEKEMRKPLRRVVSLSPSITANLFFLGLGSMVVGVTEQCLLPEESEDRERIGSFAFPDPEKIASLRPDLVVVQGRIHDPYLKALKDRNISTFRSSPKTVAGIFQELETLCA
ncbi:MAG: helical backbone metal receptor, partial [Desulfobacterota bacterium]|nr:helical backbone metal receptor [Thermodesulfobacteriota bacterium]